MYYRARYYNPEVARFISQDKLTVWPDFGEWAYYSYLNNKPTRARDPYGLFGIDDSCKCQNSGPGGPPGGGPPNLSDRIQKEVDEWCNTKVYTEITNPKLLDCLLKRCRDKKFKIKCQATACYEKRKNGGTARFDGIYRGGKQVYICNDMEIPPGGMGPGRYGEITIHEASHSCKWKDCGGDGVPDGHRDLGHCIGNKDIYGDDE